MKPLLQCLLFVGLLAGRADGADPQDRLFASWGRAQRDVKSLVVRFSLETRDLLTEERRKFDGAFRLLRAPTGEVYASYEVTPAGEKADGQAPWSGLLSDGTVYVLNPKRKTAIRFRPADGDLLGFLEKYFNPFVRLLDRKRAEECRLEVVKQDEWYTYLAVQPKRVKKWGWFPDSFWEGRAVLMNKPTDQAPKDMPRQLWYTGGVQEYTFEIGSWRLNGAEPPKPEEFVKPEDRPGWDVTDWPFQSKK